MEIKKLNWRDNVTDIGKEKGLFYILSDVKELDIKYCITNYNCNVDGVHDKFYLESIMEMRFGAIECDNIEEAKLKAQEHFKQTVLKLFFE